MENKIIKNNRRVAGIREIYQEALGKIEEDLTKLRKRKPSITMRTVSYNTFSRVIVLYFSGLFTNIIKKGTLFKMYQRFGQLYIVKSKCTRYKPTKVVFTTVDGQKVREVVNIDLSETNGYFYFAFWDTPIKWRHYRFRLAKRWKHLIQEEVSIGNDYLDYTMERSGRKASLTYEYV